METRRKTRMTAVANADKMICPNCRVEMNHHCDKLVYTPDPPDAGRTDPSLGGFIEEFHACPKCGYGASRPA
jgi:ribosomal protein S27AE